MTAVPGELPLIGLATALGLGLLIGVVRERRKPADATVVAGLRTHALTALAGAVGLWLGPVVFAVLVALIGVLVAYSYKFTRKDDPGLTGEVGLVLTALLGGLALREPAIAAGLGVIATSLLYAKAPLHRIARELLSEQEVHDGLLLLAAALVVLPLLPDRAVDPWGALKPSSVWKLVVLVMAVGMLGHVALRAVGARWGLPVAGFFSGFVSSTAAVAGFGQRVRDEPALRTYGIAGAMLANLASLLLFMAVVGTVAPRLLAAATLPLGAAAAVLLVAGLAGVWRGPREATQLPVEATAAAFRIRHALLLAVAIAGVLLVSAALEAQFGHRGALIAATLAALAEWHAAAATVAQLAEGGRLTLDEARLGLVALLGASTVAKAVVAFLSGGRAYGLRVTLGLVAMTAAAALVAWLA